MRVPRAYLLCDAEGMNAAHTVRAEDVASRWPVPSADDDKYSRGVLGAIAGSETYPGAAVLAVSGAIRAGVGMVRYVGPRRAADLVLAHRPEAVVHALGSDTTLPRADAWLVGSGLPEATATDLRIAVALTSDVPCVVDAGAITRAASALADSRSSGHSPARTLLTPHARELERACHAIGRPLDPLTNDDPREAAAVALSDATGATVLLKGSRTVVASPGEGILTLPPAPPWLATAGSGDVLAGIAGALLAQGVETRWAGAMASFVHAEAARLDSDGGPIAALDIATALPRAISGLLASR